MRQLCRVIHRPGKYHSMIIIISEYHLLFDGGIAAFHNALLKSIEAQDAEVKSRESEIGKGYW